MLVIISDLHLTDGSTGTAIGANAFYDFRERLRDLAYNASFRKNRETGGIFYDPIKTVDLVLLGDIFDIIRSTIWNEEERGSPGYVRPWDDPGSDLFQNKIRTVTDAILEKNATFFQAMKEVGTNQFLDLPRATDDRKVAPSSEGRVPVDVRIHYLVGNHDWFFYLDGETYGAVYDDIRQKVVDALGLANPPGRFPHDPTESDLLMETYRQHRLFARHGDIYDPFNYDQDKNRRDVSTLGDAIVVDLINRFPVVIKQKMGHELPQAFIAGLDELANVRPSLMTPVWIDSLMHHMGVGEAESKRVKKIWDDLANDLLQLEFVREKDKRFRLDQVDVLQATLRFARGVSFRRAAEIVSFIQEKFWGGETSFAKYALKEDAFKNKTADHFVYGHTHHYEVVPLDSRFIDGRTINQVYINSGTWHPLHQLTIKDQKDQRFVPYNVVSYLAFFKDNEHVGHPYVTWTGVTGR